ncbi:hypothetical protein QTQ03_19215 [Micromonospora sp. WMMA1363]|uniref:hypothetical protein n=1 Tax=Micromonospora sp. WMMA1363 TaxID=3053985 RepID=UPI00259D2DF9|nr:hypothetical protein [Micromonospora sp. WMMA1363]MDM4721617.1 hypothetical protein [Micromonospora sp. WMMA1363]
MTTRERTYAKANNQYAATFTELWIVGSPEDIAAMIRVASASGRLVYVSAPTRMGGDDTRHRRYLRLRTT